MGLGRVAKSMYVRTQGDLQEVEAFLRFKSPMSFDVEVAARVFRGVSWRTREELVAYLKACMGRHFIPWVALRG